MLKYAALILLFANLLGLQAQSTAFIDANNIKAGFGASGALFEGGLVAPKTSLLKSISAARFWIAGKNGTTLHLSAQAAGNSLPAFWPGPLDTAGSPADTALWDTIITITAAQVAAHKQNWNKQGYTMPDAIKHWPGSNSTPGFKKITAPFFDFNENNFYDPEEGEYPYIKGDQAVYFICNDKANTHIGLPLGVEVHGMAFIFSNTAGLESTVFLELGFINRSANNYTDVYAGIYTDFALGNVNDDYAGTFPAKNAFYVYNATASDTGTEGYGANPPTQAVVFLNRKLDFSIQMDPSANSGSDTNRGLPVLPEEYYTFLQGKWRDGTPVTEGINGYKTGGNPVSHIFAGDPCNGDTGWVEAASSLPPGRRIMLGSAGPMTLNSQSYIKLDVAFIWSRDAATAKGSICKLLSDIDEVKAFYNKEISSSPGVKDKHWFALYPNPAKETVYISSYWPLPADARLTVTDLQGRKVIDLPAASTSEISVANLQSGVYFITLASGTSLSVQKVVVQR